LLALLLLLPGAAALAAGHAASPAKPNIVVIWTDDETLEEMRFMPKTRALIGDRGVTFDNYFDSFSLCCPARATFLTGQYAHSDGVQGNALPDGGYYKLDSSRTLPVWLQRAGYYTALVGKYLNNYGTRSKTEIPPGWNDWHGSIDPSTYRYYGYTLNENGKLTTYCAKADPSCYQTDVYAQKAVEIIQRQAKSAQPFFLWLTPVGPHSGQPAEPGDPGSIPTPVPPPRYKGALAGTPLPLPPSFNEADVSDKPLVIRRRKLLSAADIAAIQASYQQRAETVMGEDDLVERVLNALSGSGVLDKTLIVFSSDNGFFHGEHRVPNGKVLLYEPSVHLPLLIRGPGVPAGAHRSQLAWDGDLAPTILEAAHAAPSGRVLDGASLWPLIRDPGKELGRDIVLENGPGGANFKAIRTYHYKYAEYANGDRELYDLVRDPYELTNVAGNLNYATIQALLATRLLRLRDCHGAPCREAPPLRLVLSYKRRAGHCAVSPVTAQVRGAVTMRLVLSVNGRTRANDSHAPFRVRMRLARGTTALVRARVFAVGDRVVTLDRKLRICR
jgi:arylsulfatase A-like enzyme